jgi:hypothetical protein
MEKPRLQALVGQYVFALIPHLNGEAYLRVKLLGIEAGGIWIESEKVTQLVLERLKMPTAKTPTLFVPYSQITFLMTPIDQMALSESAFGVKE